MADEGADNSNNAKRERVLSRRDVLRYGAIGAGALACGSAAWLWRRRGDGSDGDGGGEGLASIFRNDAPDEETWRLWNERGWVKEAYHYRKVGRDAQCLICPNACVVPPGGRSHCRDKINRDGTLYTMVYANPCSVSVVPDPIEKKPLYHFLPGSRSFSFGTAGCILRCLNCQNWTMSQSKPEETNYPHGRPFRLTPETAATMAPIDFRRLVLPPDDAVAMAKATNSASMAYTYSEPIAFYEYTLDTCKAARAAGLRNVLVTCGSINDRPLRELAAVVDAAHIDLKGFDEPTYRKLNGGRLATILRTLKTLAELNVWFEVINLVVPTWTDDLEAIKRMSGWLVKNVGADRPVHFSRFHPTHKLTQLPPTSAERLIDARRVALAEGLRYVYIGNVPGLEVGQDTACPSCGKTLIKRQGYRVEVVGMKEAACAACGQAVAGVWK